MISYVIIFILISLIFSIVFLEQKAITGEARKRNRRRWPAHFALFMIAIGIQMMLPIGAASAAIFAKSNGYGVINWLNIPVGFASILSFLTLSLTSYLLHFAMHKIPLLWRLHQVHHSDYELDITTSYRTHPIAVVITLGVIFTIVCLLGPLPEIVLFYSLIVLLINFFHHSSLAWPKWVENTLAKIIITSSQHHIHHSNYQPETDSNYSVDLCVWDKLFGTHLKEPIRTNEKFAYGLKQISPTEAVDLHAILSSPFKRK